MNIDPLFFDHEDQQHKLDLLVDGELSDAERRQLLTTFDDQPGGWRQCALAFLEAQSWGQDLEAIAQPAAVLPAAAQRHLKPQPLSYWRSHNLGTLLALAASVLVCFGLGFRAHDWWHVGTRGALLGGAGSNGLNSLAGDGVAEGGRPDLLLPTSSDRAPLNGAMDQVTLVLDDAQSADAAAVEIPILRQRPTTGSLFGASAQVPAHVQQALERLGSRVRQHQQLIPVRLNDGREAIVPVNRVELEPVNLRDYQ